MKLRGLASLPILDIKFVTISLLTCTHKPSVIWRINWALVYQFL